MNKQRKHSVFTIILVLILAASTALGQFVSIPIRSGRADTSQSTRLLDQATAASDYYDFINREWLKETQIPEGEAYVGSSSEIQDRNDKTVRRALEELNQTYDSLKKDSGEWKMLTLYRMLEDFDTRDALGFSPIQKRLEQVEEASNVSQMKSLLEKMFPLGYSSLAQLGVEADTADSNVNAVYIYAPSIGLSKQYYEGEDAFSQEVRNGYLQYMADCFTLAGDTADQARERAQQVMAFEKELASALLSKEEEADMEKQYHVMRLEEVEAMSPNLPLGDMIRDAGLLEASKIVVSQPEALQKANALFTEENLSAMKNQLRFFIISENSGALNKKLIEAGARYDAVMTGVYSVSENGDIAFGGVSSYFGELLGKLFVEKSFSPKAKADAEEMVSEIIAEYKERLGSLDWMSQETKEHAIKKLEKMHVKVGYPDAWLDYSDVAVTDYAQGGDLVQFKEAWSQRSYGEMEERLKAPVDKSSWGMDPQEVNAYYDAQNNEIVFPAGILQSPYYDVSFSREENLGGIGAVMGHEISHALDDSGAQFDENGNYTNWWRAEDYEKFQAKVQQAADIYSAIEVLPGYHINGEICTGEILADLGGMTIVMEIARKENLDTKKIFEAYARSYREKMTDEMLISSLTDEHPPAKYRTNNIVNLLDEFYQDYEVQEGDPMYVKPENRLKVW